MTFSYPVFLDLHDVPVLLVGGGGVAMRKVAALVAAGARVTVIAPEVRSELAEVAAVVERRPFAEGDCAGFRLVLTATDDAAVNARVHDEATAAGIWVNSADDPANCTFILPAVARRGPVMAAVSTGGASPALAGHLRSVIADSVLTEQVQRAAHDLARQRAEIHAAGGSTEDVEWGDRLRAALELS
ncbi:MAG: bifunctional precorrin-2 dehydrogenase/sirohydrochlorin ferrochelatase [Actinomycetota bacterium]|nr:bifunctional precorrin-2 dehydrogenase/sirohydrochlorin ferrochelatase [Actinomycetota bacterium]